jgi:two-component sensor histidine kinase
MLGFPLVGLRSKTSLDYPRALLNILEDSAFEKEQLRDMQSAVLNILEDSAEEKQRLEGTERAILNILEDFILEKTHLEEMKRAVLNILDDLAVERDRLEETQLEVLRSEQAIRLSLREKETLLKEVHHRVKNNLQVIASLLRLQSRYLQDEAARGMFEESHNRVHSISLVHEMLYQADDLARVDFDNYLRTLTKNLVDGWRGMEAVIEVEVEAAGVLLAVDNAIPCGLIVNELVTNALKHAFPKGTSGTVQVKAVLTPESCLQLSVADNGIGMPADMDLRRSGSLGLELVSTLVRQLRATVKIRRDGGTVFEIAFQVSGN